MKPLALLCLIAICLSGGLAAAQNQRFTSPAGFSLNVPEGWQVLTKEQGQSVSDDLKAKTKFNPTRMAALIYSPTDPRVNLNVIVLMGAVPMDDDAAKGYAQMLKDQSAQAGVALSGFAVNHHTYGPHNTLLADYDMDFSNSNGPNKDLGKVHQWQVVYSGASNTYVVTCTAGVSAFPMLAPVFERVLGSMGYPGSAAPPSMAPAAPPAPAPAPAQPTLAPTLTPAPTPVSSPAPAAAPQASMVQTVASDSRSKEKPVRMYTPKEADVYCAGFVTDAPFIKDLYVITGAEGGLQEIFTERDTVYLSRGAGYIVRPGGDYMLLRPITDPAYRMEMFVGQNKLMKAMGTVYSEVGRLRIDIVHEYVATAKVTHTCKEIQPGDIAVPLNLRPTPPAPSGVFDRFAPTTGKNQGIIATGKDFEGTLGAGKTVYLDIGEKQGVETGQLYRIFRTFATSSGDPNRAYLDQTPHEIFGMRQNYKLTPAERAVLPREILGEMVILSVHGRTATALITMSGAEIFPGDEVELK